MLLLNSQVINDFLFQYTQIDGTSGISSVMTICHPQGSDILLKRKLETFQHPSAKSSSYRNNYLLTSSLTLLKCHMHDVLRVFSVEPFKKIPQIGKTLKKTLSYDDKASLQIHGRTKQQGFRLLQRYFCYLILIFLG